MMHLKMEKRKFYQFKQEMHERFPRFIGNVQLCTNGAGEVRVACVRGFKMTGIELVEVMELAETFMSPPPAEQTSIPAWQPVRRTAPRYSNHAKTAASKIRLR